MTIKTRSWEVKHGRRSPEFGGKAMPEAAEWTEFEEAHTRAGGIGGAGGFGSAKATTQSKEEGERRQRDLVSEYFTDGGKKNKPKSLFFNSFVFLYILLYNQRFYGIKHKNKESNIEKLNIWK